MQLMRETTIPYDTQCALEFAALLRRVEHLFVDIDINCPYGLRQIATFHQATFAPINDRVMELFLAAGYRRNGNCLYSMRCACCNACIPIRLKVEDFQASRSQKRVIRKNTELSSELLPLAASAENLDLCERFLRARYPQDSNSGRGYFRDFFLNNIVSSAQIQYRLNGQLVGVSIVDFGYNWLNAVYFFFDPDQQKRSLGTYNILQLIEICKKWDVEYLYLGYLIDEVPAMSYKSRFTPHSILTDQGWINVGKD